MCEQGNRVKTCLKYTGQSDRNHQVGKAAEVTCDKSSLLGLNEEHFSVVSQRAYSVCAHLFQST